MNMLSWKTNGFYLEIGAAFPYTISNTYTLEKQYGWKGVSVEISQDLCDKFNLERSNFCHCLDATTADYSKLLKSSKAPKRIDYLQLDIEPAPNTLQALKQMPLNDYRFSVITFEHDLYSDPSNAAVKQEAFDILTAAGYQMVVSNVCNSGSPYEDWYVDPLVVDESVWGPVVNNDLDYRQLFV
jgi:hypothetical protein